ncbi:MAG TPA: hypothetical protein VFW19_14875 [Allosphingosinicella sp.]|nr:hypothetical protein [Allosphingosinicella sp.]
MRPAILLLSAPLLLTAAASSGPHGDRGAAPGAVRCIDPHQIIARHAERPDAVVFEMAGGITYRNDLIGSCPGAARATPASIVQIQPDSGNLCANDHISVYDPVEVRGNGATARCRLGTFTPVSR